MTESLKIKTYQWMPPHFVLLFPAHHALLCSNHQGAHKLCSARPPNSTILIFRLAKSIPAPARTLIRGDSERRRGQYTVQFVTDFLILMHDHFFSQLATTFFQISLHAFHPAALFYCSTSVQRNSTEINS